VRRAASVADRGRFLCSLHNQQLQTIIESNARHNPPSLPSTSPDEGWLYGAECELNEGSSHVSGLLLLAPRRQIQRVLTILSLPAIRPQHQATAAGLFPPTK
jgi:hypothetical protein